MAMAGTVNTVRYLQSINFSQLTMKKKIDIKTKGRHTKFLRSGAERCFSTLKRIKTFLRSTIATVRLSALAMISIEDVMITESNDFNDKVTNHFATSKNRRMDLIFK